MFNKDTHSMAVLDIETEFIGETGISGIQNIYCIAVVIIDKGFQQPAKLFTSHWTPYSDGSLMESILLINSADYMSFHNGIGFDVPVIERLLKIELTPIPYDTLILTKLIYSKDNLFGIDAQLDIPKDLWGSYSLKAFGMRLGVHKDTFMEFDEGLSEKMATYCKIDTEVSAALILHLMQQTSWPLETVIELEHAAASIIQKQEVYGFYLDVDKARKLNTELLSEKLTLATELATMFSPKFLKEGQVKTYKKKSIVRKFLPNDHYTPLLGT